MTSMRKSRGNTFAEWLAEMHRLQKQDQVYPYCDDAEWRLDYDGNNSPEESWREEKEEAAIS